MSWQGNKPFGYKVRTSNHGSDKILPRIHTDRQVLTACKTATDYRIHNPILGVPELLTDPESGTNHCARDPTFGHLLGRVRADPHPRCGHGRAGTSFCRADNRTSAHTGNCEGALTEHAFATSCQRSTDLVENAASLVVRDAIGIPP